MRNPNIHRVRVIEERDRIKAQFEAYKSRAEFHENMYRIILFALVVLIGILLLLGAAHA